MVCIVDGDRNGPALVGVVDDRSGRDWPARDWASPILQATHEDAAPLEVVERTFLQRTQALAQLARLQWLSPLKKEASKFGYVFCFCDRAKLACLLWKGCYHGGNTSRT